MKPIMKIDDLKHVCIINNKMTTPVKVYQNVSYKELVSFSEQNPNRHRVLEPIEIQPSAQELELDSLHLSGYSSYNVDPANILSLLICIADPSYYALSPKNIRIQQLIEISTALQQETEQLKTSGISRKRKKIYDLIGVAYNGGRMEDKDHLDLFQGITYLRQIQFVMMKETVQDQIEDHEQKHESGLKGEIFFSSNPITWSKDYPTWIVDYRGRWVAIPTRIGIPPLSATLSEWLTTIEQHGWIVQWPEIEGTKVELIQQLSTFPSWKETDRKLLKETLSARLGKTRSLHHLENWT